MEYSISSVTPIKNCEDTLPMVLDYIADNFQEACFLIDPTSKDGSEQMVLDFDSIPTVVEYMETESFSDALEHCYMMGTMPWVLHIDADELFDVENCLLKMLINTLLM